MASSGTQSRQGEKDTGRFPETAGCPNERSQKSFH